MKVDCDVIIVNYNAGKLLIKAVESLLQLPNINVIVVDNASDDSSLSTLDTITKSNNITIVKNSKNRGFSAACNQGIKASSADLLFFLNPDAKLDITAFLQLKSVLESEQNIGMVGGFLQNEDGSEQGGGRRAMPTPWRLFVRATGLHHLGRWWPNIFYDLHLDKQPLPKEPIDVEAISGACMLVKRDAIENVGFWDEGYFLHVEDLDWCQRFRLAGYRILFVPNAPIIHQKGSCSATRPVWVEWHKHKDMLRFYRKFLKESYPGPLMWLVSAGIWVRFSLIDSAITIRRLIPS